MGGRILEYYGYRDTDKSDVSLTAAAQRQCPFVHRPCTKRGHDNRPLGVCTVRQRRRSTPIICCPERLYANDNELLRIVSSKAFADGSRHRLYSGMAAKREAVREGGAIAVFGHDWGGELKLPQRDSGMGNYYIDWVLAKLDAHGDLEEFTAVEVQTVDTSGNYTPSLQAVRGDRSIAWSPDMGLNWENVNKRISSQIIYKGQVLQRERLCRSGLWFVTPEPVYRKIIARLGGEDNVGFGYVGQPGAVHFLRYDIDNDSEIEDGKPTPLAVVGEDCTTVERVNAAFSHVVLPEPGVYENAIRAALEQQ